MVIDTSALLAILFGEPELTRFTGEVYKAKNRYMSSVSALEASIVVQVRLGKSALKQLDALVRALAIDLISFDENQMRLARSAWTRYGKGRHAAKLNFGDCCSYALTKQLKEKLLFKGNDFSKTDIPIVA